MDDQAHHSWEEKRSLAAAANRQIYIDKMN